MTVLFQNIAIIGFGLIGSSLARAIREHGLADRITGIDRDEEVCKKLMELELADAATTSCADGVKDADLVILSVPVGAYESVARDMAPHLKQGAVITDVGSVKQTAVDSVQPHLPEHVSFIPGHPIAGTENSGPESGFSTLFKGRWTILTPLESSPLKDVEQVTKLWEACGADIEIMDAKRHDLVLAITSHLPHLIAYTIVGTATDLEEHTKNDVIKFSASGFRDFTRIAASDPVMWRDIFLNNKDAVLEIVQRFNEDLTALQRAIRWDDGDYLQDVFTRTRAIKRQVIEAGQSDYPTANKSDSTMPIEAAPKKASGS